MTVIALTPTGSGLSSRSPKRAAAPACPRIRSMRKSVSRTTVSRHPAGLGVEALAEPLAEPPFRGTEPGGGAPVEDPDEFEERELPRQPVDDVAEALALPLEGVQPGVGALREVDRLRRHVCVYVCMGLNPSDVALTRSLRIRTSHRFARL